MNRAMSVAGAPRSKTLATWLAFLGGGLGLHRFYLRGTHDVWGWVHWPPTVLGAWGVSRMLQLGQDDRLAWALIPLLGLSVSASMLAAIVYGLTNDAAWDATYNARAGKSRPGGWLAIFGVVGALSVGATVLIATIAFSGQRYFESQIDATSELRPLSR